jgi:hypothetical protein
MRNWTFWEWVAYACLFVGALILAAETGFRISPDFLASVKPQFVQNPIWRFAPLGLIVTGSLVLIASAIGWLGPYGFWRRPFTAFLERDSQSELMGVQTFQNVSYIQISVKANRPLKSCMAWIARAEYSPEKLNQFSLEHNERVPCTWSKHVGKSDVEADIDPQDPPFGSTWRFLRHKCFNTAARHQLTCCHCFNDTAITNSKFI